MTSSHENIFRVIGHLCGEFTGHRWIHKGQWRGALMFSLIFAWISSCVNNREAGDLRRHSSHYDVTVIYHALAISRQKVLWSIWSIVISSLLITSFYADLSICVNKFCNAESTISMDYCKTAVSPLLTHWRYCSIAHIASCKETSAYTPVQCNVPWLRHLEPFPTLLTLFGKQKQINTIFRVTYFINGLYFCHDDVIKLKLFSRYRSSVWGIYRYRWIPLTKGQ